MIQSFEGKPGCHSAVTDDGNSFALSFFFVFSGHRHSQSCGN